MSEKVKRLLRVLGAKNLTEVGVKLLNPELFGLPPVFQKATLHLEGKQVEEFIQAIRLVAWNRFDGERVAEVIRRLHEKGLIMELEYAGDEIRITPPFWTSQASNYKGDPKKGRKLTDEERRSMFYQIKATLADANPDELDFEETFGNLYEDLPDGELVHFHVRAWWD